MARCEGVFVVCTLLLGGRAFAQQGPAPATQAEAGGRLVVSSETIDVVADRDDPPRSSSVATKTDTPLLETPRSVSVVDRTSLDDMQAINVTQAHDFTLGVTPEDERGTGFARGFLLGFYDLRRDGLRIYTWSVREPAALDRIQYLRGPAGILYGDGSPGGLVNLVLKKPLPAPRYGGSIGAGGNGYLRGTVDATGPLRADRRARYRLVAAGERLDNGFENDESRISVLPMLAFDLGDGTTLHLDAEYYDQRGRGYRHIVPATAEAQAGDFSAIPWDLNMASPHDHWRGWNASAGARLDTAFSPSASLHAAGRYTRIVGDLDVEGLASLAPDGRTAQRFHYREDSEWNEYQGDAFVDLAARTGSVAHRIVAGFEAGLSTTDSHIGIGGAPPLDIYDPVYAPHPAEPALLPTRYDVVRLGVYVQDQLRLGGRLTVVPSLRASRVRLEDRAPASASTRDNSTSDDAFSPGLGAVFLVRPHVSAYASYADGFQAPAPNQFAPDGKPLEPVDSRSLEAGLKADVLERRLSLSAAAFRIRQTNVPEPDRFGFYQQIGEGTSRGLELEAVGRLGAGFAIRAGYAFTAAEITQDVSGFVGNSLPNAPRHKGNLWAEYRARGPARGLSIGAGIVRVSERFTARDNAVRLPPYTRLDSSASYELVGGKLVATLTGQNLTDTRYVTSGSGRVFFAGPPRRVTVTLTTAF